MLTMPTNIGYAVFWDLKVMHVNGKPMRGDFYTKDKEEAEKKKAELEKSGYENVTMTEAIF